MELVGIVLADGRERVSVKEGSVRLGPNLILHSVYYVEDFQADLISLCQLMDENQWVVQLADHFLVVQDRSTRTVIGVSKRTGGTFHFRSMEVASAATVRDNMPFELWHKRMGHPSDKIVGLLPGVSNVVASEISNKACDICLRAKQTRMSFPISENKTKQIFDLIHCDLWGPYRTPTHSGARFFLTIVDDYSRGGWVFLMNEKFEAPNHLKNFLTMTTRQFQSQIKAIRSDNGSEFLCLSEYFKPLGIVHETSCVATPQQNGRVERKHKHILNVARALRFQSDLPIEFWGEFVLTAAYLINRTPNMVLQGMTSYERIYGEKPVYERLRVFGSLCYAHDQSNKGDKFASRSRRCVFVGYPYGKKGGGCMTWKKISSLYPEMWFSLKMSFHLNLQQRKL